MANPLQTIALLVKNPTSVGTVVLDAALSETHTTSAMITSHPVEEGMDITDHIHRQPDALSITGIVSNISRLLQDSIPGVAQVSNLSSLIRGVNEDRAKTAYDDLRDLVEQKQLVKIVTTLREYDNMLLDNITIERNEQFKDALYFTVSARQIRIVSTKSVGTGTATASTLIPKNTKKAGKQDLGNKTKVAAPESTPTSIAGSGYSGLFR